MIREDILRQHWDKVEKGYFDRNRKYIDDEGWLTVPSIFYKPTPKGMRLLEKKDDSHYRPKTLKTIRP